MKKASLFFLLLIVSIASFSQQKSLKKIYLLTGAGGSSHDGSHYEIGLQAVINNRWSSTISYQEFAMKPGNLPADYKPETGTILFFPYTSNIEINMKLYSVTAGRYFQLGRNTWFATEAGISLVQGEKASFQPDVIETSYFPFFGLSTTTSNYKTTIEKKTTLGGMLRADINWGFSSIMGLGAGVFANLNSIQIPIGFQTKLTLGLMGRNKKEKKKK